MNVSLSNIEFRADAFEVKAAIAKILHSEDFMTSERLINFHVELCGGNKPGYHHNSTGVLTVPDRKIGERLLALAKEQKLNLRLYGRRITLREPFRNAAKPDAALLETLRKVAYRDPALDKEIEDKRLQLQIHLRVLRLQIGVWVTRPEQGRPGIFSVEWDKDYAEDGIAVLSFEYENKLMRIQLGDPMQDELSYAVLLKYSNIRETWIGYEFGNPYVCFELITPPLVECQWINRTLTGTARHDTQKFRQRIGSMDEGHARISPYAHHIRIPLYQSQDMNDFVRLCQYAGMKRPKEAVIDAEKRELFTSKKLLHVGRVLKALPYNVAFQVEALLHSALLSTDDFLNILLGPITRLSRDHPAAAGDILRHFVKSLPTKPINQTILKFFQSQCARELADSDRSRLRTGGLIECHHVTFTPTRMALEGPYVIQSNRVIRRYLDFHEHFIRVDFRDEDHLQYRWDREVDGTTLLQKRVGGILRDGFDLAGRHFEFLAYSSSSLRDHAVWFVSPFDHPEEGLVNGATIRSSLGHFSELLKTPARYAARLAQAFTATDPSVRIVRDQWKIVPDIGEEPYLFTDGVGTVSRELADKIWSALCRAYPDYTKRVRPSVFQIRFLGFKGVVCVDNKLDGIMMCLRESMNKFDAKGEDEADIEIAQAFHSPHQMYLNRPLIMIYEDLGVHKEAFLNLQNDAVVEVRSARHSVAQFATLLKTNGLGFPFGLSRILWKLESYGLDLDGLPAISFNDPFIANIIRCAMTSVLRDIKFRSRIPVPGSYQLVGIADEGQAYIKQGHRPEDVFTLREGEVFACVQLDPDSEPIYLERTCVVSRSPTVHPGDVQRVWAIGKPPPGKLCFFRNLTNCIVFAATGKRALPSCLAGGDLDGDTYDVCMKDTLFTTLHSEAAEYPPGERWEIDVNELRNPKTNRVEEERIIPYVCDFIVEYINSDVLGLLSDNHLIRADQSSEGVFDAGCLTLAKLCSDAVDYPKNGIPVDKSAAPRRLIPYKPDWKEGEEENPRKADFYRSERALGELYRQLEIATAIPNFEDLENKPLSNHPISNALKLKLENRYDMKNTPWSKELSDRMHALFDRYVDELRYICTTHTLSDRHDVQLSEVEVVTGTILAQCAQQRWRSERIYRMRVHSSELVRQTKNMIIYSKADVSLQDVRQAIKLAWFGWEFAIEGLASPTNETFGLNSFALVMLGLVLECMDIHDNMPGH